MSTPNNTPPASGRHSPSLSADEQVRKVPVIEEELHIDKKAVESGRVRVTKKVHEEQVPVDVPLTYDVTDVRRVEVNRFVDTAPPAVRRDGDTTIIPVLREVLVKRLLLVEEIHITTLQQQQQEHREVTLRREAVEVEREAAPPKP